MRDEMIRRMFIILIITVLCLAAAIYAVVSITTSNAINEDIRERATGVKNTVLESLNSSDFTEIGKNIEANGRLDEILGQFNEAGRLKRLYIAQEDGRGGIITTSGYVPTGKALKDFEKSLSEGISVLGSGIYRDDTGNGIYTIFWPVTTGTGEKLGVVGMEFDVDTVYKAQKLGAGYSIALAAALIIMFSTIGYLSMNRASEPYYKKLAYTDILTGYENRMAFEHRLRECEEMVLKGERVTLIVFDVNNLKTVNDTQGHKAGDLYLKITADVINENLKGLGKLYRIGGDEYAAVIAGKTGKDDTAILKALKEEKRETVKNQPFSCAFGAATFTKGTDETMREVFKRADEEMYAEKKRQKAATGQTLR